MIVNGVRLLEHAPIENMMDMKCHCNGLSYGLTESGYDIRIKQDVILKHDRRFVIASTIEKFKMPYNLVGVVHDKSTWARKGLSVFNTVIEPGWRGYLTLELVYHGSGKLKISAGSGIGQVLFHQSINHANYTGKYQNQPDMPVKAITGSFR